MNKELLQQYIYTETLLSQLYRQVSAVAPSSRERAAFLAFSQEATQNAERLTQIYRDEFGTNFNPMIPDTILQGGYYELLNELLDIELTSATALRSNTYFQSDYNLNEVMRRMADDKMDNIITILAIMTNYNSIQIEQLQKK